MCMPFIPYKIKYLLVLSLHSQKKAPHLYILNSDTMPKGTDFISVMFNMILLNSLTILSIFQIKYKRNGFSINIIVSVRDPFACILFEFHRLPF